MMREVTANRGRDPALSQCRSSHWLAAATSPRGTRPGPCPNAGEQLSLMIGFALRPGARPWCRVPRKPRTTLIRLRLAMIELPKRHGTAGQDSHPKGVLAAVPSHVPDNGRDMSETLIVPKALSQHHAIHTHSRHIPTRLAASKWFEARQNALRSAAAFLTGSGSPSLMQPASQ